MVDTPESHASLDDVELEALRRAVAEADAAEDDRLGAVPARRSE
jgi:hypothetical protein